MNTLNKISLGILAITLTFGSTAVLAQPLTPLTIPNLKIKPVISDKQIKKLRQVELSQITGTLDLRAAKPELVLTQKLRNLSRDTMTMDLDAAGVDTTRLRLPSRGEKTVNWKLPVRTAKLGRQAEMVQASPQLFINKGSMINPAKRFSIKLQLPQSAKKIIKSNKPLVSERQRDGSMLYNWKGENEYLTTWAVWWTNSETDIDLNKTVRVDQQSRVATVTVTVKNQGNAAARGIRLSEDFPPQDFTGMNQGSAGQFRTVKGEINDQRLIWEYSLPDLPSGQSKTVRYKLKVKPGIPNVRLFETVGLEDGEPIAVSNAVTGNI